MLMDVLLNVSVLVLLVWVLHPHVNMCVILLALQKFSESGDLIIEETCTQNLQTCHHVRPYKGGPYEAKYLPLANQTFDVVFDENKDMPCYQDTFRNI